MSSAGREERGRWRDEFQKNAEDDDGGSGGGDGGDDDAVDDERSGSDVRFEE